MFRSARLKLTAWYLLIIMVISFSFSLVIYRIVTREIDRVERMQRTRIELRFPRRLEDEPPFGADRPRFFWLDPELIAETKQRLIFNLALSNLAILGASTLAGYFLAGRTLEPIENSLEEQKRFIADASHELRTPLTALKTSMEVSLKDQKMSLTQAKNLIKDNLQQINGLQSLSNKLLSLARYQSNGHSLDFNKINLGQLIDKVVKKISPLAKEKGIELGVKSLNQPLNANEESLEEMLLILLDNAVKYTPKGGKVTVETEINKKWLILKVKDTGIGIAKEDLPHLFDRFYRADQSRTKEKVAGFGLGLSLAKKIMEIHRGRIEVASTLGKGSTFTLKLPLKS